MMFGYLTRKIFCKKKDRMEILKIYTMKIMLVA